MDPLVPFRDLISIRANLVAGPPPDDGWQPLGQCPLVVLVGGTGVGKSTTLAALAARGVRFSPLPDRRELTDALIIPAMQAAQGLPPEPVTDRSQRFALTRRFREGYPGGMAQALTWLSILSAGDGYPLLFDGLRGENEVRFALDSLPAARMIMLTAPDLVRVSRLLGRKDAFDQIALSQTSGIPADDPLGEALLGDDGAIFTPEGRAALMQLVSSGQASPDELRAKVRIVAEERRNYDPAATRNALEVAGTACAIVVDTVQLAPDAVAETIAGWLAGSQKMANA